MKSVVMLFIGYMMLTLASLIVLWFLMEFINVPYLLMGFVIGLVFFGAIFTVSESLAEEK